MLFNKIKGQERALNILRTGISNNTFAQSYLYYGPEGVGKFTTALYFAMAINCESSHEFRPCGDCRSCKTIVKFNHPDITYIFPIPNMQITEEGEFKKNDKVKEYREFIQNRIETPWKKYHCLLMMAKRMSYKRLR